MSELTGEVLEYAINTLHETEENKETALLELEKWAKTNPQLNVRTDIKYLMPFLRCCKYDLDRTKTKIQNFYRMRRDMPEWFEDRDPLSPDIQQLARMGCFVTLRETQDNRLVVIIRPTIHDPKTQSLDTVLKCSLMVLDIAVMEEELAQIYGVIAIIDLSNVSFAHAKQLSIGRIKHLVHAWQNYYCRPKKIEFINAPSYVNIVLNVFKKFMSAKLKKRIRVSYDIKTLGDIVDNAILPKDYGGEGTSMEELGVYWGEKLKSYADWFEEDQKYKANKNA